MELYGTIERLWRYPVKSFLGESCPELFINRRGVVGDRLFAIENRQGKFGSGKNTKRFCKIEGLFNFQAKYDDDVLIITFPDGRIFKVNDFNLNQELSTTLGQPVKLVSEKNISHFDADSLHLITSASLQWLKAFLPNSKIDERRFRPNLLINTPGTKLIEHDWISKKLLIGQELVISISNLTERCIMTSLPQQELDQDSKIIKTISKKSQHHFGVYAKIIKSGVVRVGDRVYCP